MFLKECNRHHRAGLLKDFSEPPKISAAEGGP